MDLRIQKTRAAIKSAFLELRRKKPIEKITVTELAKLAKQHNLDAIHDTVHEMARDEARHGKAFAGLLKRYFGK